MTITLSHAQSNLVIQRLSTEPRLDGDPFESAWTEVDVHSMIMLNPVSGSMPSQQTEVKFGFTDKYLYIAGYMYDNEPDKIRSASKKRDETSLSSDFFGISLDSYNDNENSINFFTNPSGLRTDFQIFNDGQSSNPMQRDWNTPWDVKTTVNNKGWFTEMQIPLSSIRYVSQDGIVTMGVAATRYISRKAEWDTYPLISNEWGFWSWAKPSQYLDVQFSNLNSINPLYFSPYLLVGLEQETALNNTEDAYKAKTGRELQAGIDVKYGISKNFTLDLTVNTDFAQVEADNQQVNLTRFSLFFPEKRQFFLERSSIFDFKFESTGQLFYSRRIGIYNGQKLPIWGGGRLIGRANTWDIGFMTLQTGDLEDDETNEEILPTINNSVLRLRKQIPLNTNSYLGGIVTSQFDVHGNYNIGYGIDAILNLFKNDYLSVAIARTSDTLYKNSNLADPSKFLIQWEKRSYKGLSYNASYIRAGSEYNPKLGFEYRKDFTRYALNLAYGWISGEASKFLKQHKVNINSFAYLRNTDGDIESARITPFYQLTTKKDHGLTLSIPIQYESVIEDFDLSSDASIPAGDYFFADVELDYNTPVGEILYLSSSVSTGKYYDGWKNSFVGNVRLALGESWNINLSYKVDQINFAKREQKFLSQLSSMRILYMYSVNTSASGFIQYNSLIKKYIINIRLRYNPKEGNDLYLVYNDNLNSDRSRDEPNLPFSNQRTILLKYTHTFRIR